MTTQLIPVFNGVISNESSLLCNARDLHEFLEVGKVFAGWIKARIEEYGFIENQDYVAIFQNRKIGHGRGKIDYHLTLDTAKELAMVERNDKGRQVRRYFIECEKQLLQKNQTVQEFTTADHRYHVQVTIRDNLFGGQISFLGKANTFRAIAVGVASDLGYKPVGFTEVPDALEKLNARRIH